MMDTASWVARSHGLRGRTGYRGAADAKMRLASRVPLHDVPLSTPLSASTEAAALPLRAVVLMVASACFFGVMAIIIRYISADLHAFEIAFFRSFFGALVALPLLMRHGPRILRTGRLWFYVLRCGIGTLSMLAALTTQSTRSCC